MTEKAIKKVQTVSTTSPTVEVLTSQQQQEVDKKLTTLTGYTTSQINQALKADNPYPARVFLKVDNQEQDIPVFFRIKEKDYQVKPCSECNYPKKGSWEKQANCQTQEVKHQVEEVWIRPKIKTGSQIEVQGYFSNSDKERKSFTATSYQVLNQELNQQILVSHE